MEKIFLDANIVLEILFERRRSEQVVGLLKTMKSVEFYVSVLTIDVVMYFIEAEKQPKDIAKKFLAQYRQLDLTAADTEWAYDNDAGDLEAALQVSCARRHGCNRLITLDQRLGKMYGRYIDVTTVR